jgi:hypothetical protein
MVAIPWKDGKKSAKLSVHYGRCDKIIFEESHRLHRLVGSGFRMHPESGWVRQPSAAGMALRKLAMLYRSTIFPVAFLFLAGCGIVTIDLDSRLTLLHSTPSSGPLTRACTPTSIFPLARTPTDTSANTCTRTPRPTITDTPSSLEWLTRTSTVTPTPTESRVPTNSRTPVTLVPG